MESLPCDGVQGVVTGNGGDGDEGGSGREGNDTCLPIPTAPLPVRRPLHQLNTPTPTSSPHPPVLITPYKYHGCQAIPEEDDENQENIDPRARKLKDSTNTNTTRLRGCQIDEGNNNNNNNNSNNNKNESSPFAYPLIWESHHHSGSGPSTSPPFLFSSTSSSTSSHQSPPLPRMPQLTDPVPGVFESPVSHRSNEREGGGKGKVRNRSGSSVESSCSKASCRRLGGIISSSSSNNNSTSFTNSVQTSGSQTFTPAKTTTTTTTSGTPSNSSENQVFRTPSERCSSKSNEGRGGTMTPKQSRAFVNTHTGVRNPFEQSAESFHLPVVSPSLFRQVVSPSQQVDSKFRWSIDQLATLQPANIETSPYNQVDAYSDPEYEQKAQDAIDKFFTQQRVVPSPWTGSNKSVNLLKAFPAPALTPSILPPPPTHSVWSQTELSLPPILPEALEEALRPFCTFTQDQWWQNVGAGNSGSDMDEVGNINNSSLPRKLLFSHDELLNATPMCSPRGTDTSDPGSPKSPSSPGLPLSSPHHPDSPKEEEVVEEKGLMWCTAVVGPYSAIMAQENPHVARHQPPTPPSPLSVPPRHPSQSPPDTLPVRPCYSPPPLPSPESSMPSSHPLRTPPSSTVLSGSKQASLLFTSPITTCTGRSHITNTSPQSLLYSPSFSPDLSPITCQARKVTPSHKTLSSPDVSPIHQQQFGSEGEVKCSIISVTSPQSCHMNDDEQQQQQQQQEGLTSPETHTLVTETTLGSTEHARSPQGTNHVDNNTTNTHHNTSHHYSPSSNNHSNSPHYLSPHQHSSSPHHLTISPHHHHHCVSYHSSPSSPTMNTVTGEMQVHIQARTGDSNTHLVNNEKHVVEFEVSVNNMNTMEACVQETTHTYSTHIMTTENHQKSECVEEDSTNRSNSERKSEEVPLDLTQEFSVTESVDGRQHNTPAKSSPCLEHRTPPTSSGQFSSSPIRDASRTPGEVEAQTDLFSNSPPLSPILYRSVSFPPPPHTDVNKPLDFLRSHTKSPPSPDLSQSMIVGDDVSDQTDDIVMDDSVLSPSIRAIHPSPLARPLTLTLVRSSSICDMETDSHPSIELEGPSQDTGYQTGSLHATNFSLYTQDLTATTTATTTMLPLPPHSHEPQTGLSDPMLSAASNGMNGKQNGFAVSRDKDVGY